MPHRADIENALRLLAPRIPAFEFAAVVDHAMDSAGLRTAMPATAAWLSLIAYLRHGRTEYDDLLRQGYDRDSARFFVADEINGNPGRMGRHAANDDRRLAGLALHSSSTLAG